MSARSTGWTRVWLACAGWLLQACTLPPPGPMAGVNPAPPAPAHPLKENTPGLPSTGETGWVQPRMSVGREVQVLASAVRSVRVSVRSMTTSFRVLRQGVRSSVTAARWHFDCLALPAGRHTIRVEAFLDEGETRPCGASESLPFEIQSGRVTAVTLPALRLEAERTGSWQLTLKLEPDSRSAITRYESWLVLSDGRTVATASARAPQAIQGLPVGVQKLRFRATAERRGRTFTHTVAVTVVVRAGEASQTTLRMFPRGLVDEDREEGGRADEENEGEDGEEVADGDADGSEREDQPAKPSKNED